MINHVKMIYIDSGRLNVLISRVKMINWLYATNRVNKSCEDIVLIRHVKFIYWLRATKCAI